MGRDARNSQRFCPRLLPRASPASPATKDVVKVGPINVQAKEQETVTIPRVAAIGAVTIGVVLLVIGRKK
jgi:hypothetical protein